MMHIETVAEIEGEAHIMSNISASGRHFHIYWRGPQSSKDIKGTREQSAPQVLLSQKILSKSSESEGQIHYF